MAVPMASTSTNEKKSLVKTRPVIFFRAQGSAIRVQNVLHP